jgi:two-component system KDP operon response regulator KdpE
MSAAPLKVLVVDDEPQIRKLLRMGLSTQGYEILDAENGKTALDLLAKKSDLVILDLGLPDIQGLELLRMIRARIESVRTAAFRSAADCHGHTGETLAECRGSRTGWSVHPAHL